MDLDGELFDEMDRLLLKTCRENGGEIQLVICREGVDDEAVCALEKHAQTMVKRGYLERLIISGTRSRMQGARLYVTFRAKPVAMALLEMTERCEALERELEELRAGAPRKRARAGSRGAPAAS
jgi:hypothetical protein